MSCTIGLVPFLLLYGAAQTAITLASTESTDEMKKRLKKSLEANNGEISQEQIDLICREYPTAFMDRDLLMKTVEEHGFPDIVDEDGTIRAVLDNIEIEFYRTDSALPYTMKILCPELCETTELTKDINDEYTLNVQEETYIKIKERLEKKNLKIDEEEILEDDSIMITVNLH